MSIHVTPKNGHTFALKNGTLCQVPNVGTSMNFPKESPPKQSKGRVRFTQGDLYHLEVVDGCNSH